MTLRADHVAGGFFVAAALLVLALSGDLPTGRLAAPGAGMVPKLVCALMIFFGLLLVLRAGESAPLATIQWRDLRHAIPVVAITGAAVALYETLGFIVTMSVMMFVLVAAVERRHWAPAALFSLGVALATYFLFTIALKTPLEQGVLGLLP